MFWIYIVYSFTEDIYTYVYLHMPIDIMGTYTYINMLIC